MLVIPYLEAKFKNCVGGWISNCLPHWEAPRSDQSILQTVKGDKIEFTEHPYENSCIPKNSISKEHVELIKSELSILLEKE